ncbi:MAG: PSD1 and planctomycete cytochrome C domain-containing protein [Pirellulaceae bacterium]|nr:PSD1 and planctomycete cytochrome C domain-containing protein [Pirellulaceae bacterium]
MVPTIRILPHLPPHLLLCVLYVATSSHPAVGEEPIRFGRDILPILSANCFACHGPDESTRKANLRIDIEQAAKSPQDEATPIVPGDLAKSSVWQRIVSNDPDTVMPPADSHKELKPEQKESIRRWILEGAAWGKHWSFELPQRPSLTQDHTANSSETPIDVLVRTNLAKRNLTMQAPASPHTLVRRVWLDLVGLPPTPEIADRFASDPSDKAYEALVDELLASPQFGEHWARMWMDLARYADTKGYEKDLGRTMWPYRDWLIQAINADMPLDQMTVEQIAGDLLPADNQDHIIPTAFHRNTMSNDEGGTDDEEFRTIAIKDRIDTTMQVWMGLTAGCAKCHSHKYDPISQSEYYQLFAIFNQTEDADRYDDAPTHELIAPETAAKRSELEARVAALTKEREAVDKRAAEQEDYRWNPVMLLDANATSGAKLTQRADRSLFVEGNSTAEDDYTLRFTLQPGKHTVLRIEALTEPYSDGQVGIGRNPRDPNFVLSELEVELVSGDLNTRLRLARPRADFEQGGWPVTAALDGDLKTGWAVSPKQRERHVALFDFEAPLDAKAGDVLVIRLKQHYGDTLTLRRFRLATISEPTNTVELPSPNAEQQKVIADIADANKKLQDFNASVPKIPIMRELKKEKYRVTKIHRRGNFLDPGDEVAAGVPVAFSSLDAQSRTQESLTNGPVDRLGLAKWLMSRDNPLTARVWANRIWARLFGLGLVETEEDFGALGSSPSNPELLDWLAVEYRDNGWSLKKLLKTILLSQAYRQSSRVLAPQQANADPRNEWLSRGARYRLSGEAVRDQSLAVAGLLSKKMGGPPVMPPQPEGLWRSTYNGQSWVNAEGDDRYRRGIYTYLKRTTPYPALTTFDGGSGEVCQIRRIRTNTPLQALVTLNDPAFLEAAGGLAKRIANQAGDVHAKALYGMRQALIRPIEADEARPLEKLQIETQASLSATPEKAKAIINVARGVVPEGLTEAEFASWIVVANTILNLDEFLTRN